MRATIFFDSVVMTPLVLLMMDMGQEPSLGVLLDRVIATLIGSGLVLAAGWIVTGRPRAA